MSIFTHAAIGTNKVDDARRFYDQVLETLGYTRSGDLGDRGSIYGKGGSLELFVVKPNDGSPAIQGNGWTISLRAPDRASVDAFHVKALSLGGVDEGLPGPRSWAPHAYAAYARDLDGNKIAAYCFEPA